MPTHEPWRSGKWPLMKGGRSYQRTVTYLVHDNGAMKLVDESPWVEVEESDDDPTLSRPTDSEGRSDGR